MTKEMAVFGDHDPRAFHFHFELPQLDYMLQGFIGYTPQVHGRVSLLCGYDAHGLGAKASPLMCGSRRVGVVLFVQAERHQLSSVEGIFT